MTASLAGRLSASSGLRQETSPAAGGCGSRTSGIGGADEAHAVSIDAPSIHTVPVKNADLLDIIPLHGIQLFDFLRRQHIGPVGILLTCGGNPRRVFSGAGRGLLPAATLRHPAALMGVVDCDGYPPPQ